MVVCRGDEEASGRRWGHEHEWAGPYIVGLEGEGKEMLARWVDDCHGSVLSNAVGESLSGQGPEADELDLGLWDVIEVLCIVGRWADYSGRSDGRICCLGSKEDGMGKRGSIWVVTCSRKESRRSDCRVGGCNGSRGIF